MAQYWHFLDRTVHVNLGLSYYNGQMPVSSILARTFRVPCPSSSAASCSG